MSDSPHFRAAERQLVLQPNGSLSRRQALLFLLWMSVVTFGIAGVFAALGYWMVLPFAGLEILALAVGLAVSLRSSGYREVLSFAGPRLRLEAGHGRPERTQEFPTHWVRLSLHPGAGIGGRSRLLIGCSGQQYEIGAFLTEAERSGLAQRLQVLLAEQREYLLAESLRG